MKIGTVHVDYCHAVAMTTLELPLIPILALNPLVTFVIHICIEYWRCVSLLLLFLTDIEIFKLKFGNSKYLTLM